MIILWVNYYLKKRVTKKLKFNELQLWLYPLSIFFIIFPSFPGKVTIIFFSPFDVESCVKEFFVSETYQNSPILNISFRRFFMTPLPSRTASIASTIQSSSHSIRSLSILLGICLKE